MTALPCSTRLDVCDALFDDEDEQARAKALPVAIALCASCPAKCDQQVTETSAPRTVELTVTDDEAGVELKPVRKPSRVSRASAGAAEDFGPWRSRAYIPPRERIPAAAAEAMELEAAGFTVEQIAERMCITAETATMLIAYDKPKPSLCCAGDRAGYLRHRWHDEEPCPASRAANTAYTREYVAANPEDRERRRRREQQRRRTAA